MRYQANTHSQCEHMLTLRNFFFFRSLRPQSLPHSMCVCMFELFLYLKIDNFRCRPVWLTLSFTPFKLGATDCKTPFRKLFGAILWICKYCASKFRFHSLEHRSSNIKGILSENQIRKKMGNKIATFTEQQLDDYQVSWNWEREKNDETRTTFFQAIFCVWDYLSQQLIIFMIHNSFPSIFRIVHFLRAKRS